MGKRRKEVFILGAGFSKGVGAPIQSELLPGILRFDVNVLEPEEKKLFVNNKKYLLEILDAMLVDIENNEFIIDLEDLYTPIDKCILNGYSFRNIPANELPMYRKSFDILISIYIKNLLEEIESNNYVSRWADYIVGRKSSEKNRKDNISFITTNWDIILDNAFYRSLSHKNGVIDYCCYTTQYKTDEYMYPGLMAIAKGYFNIKILKLHGSMNWLLCPRCGRLYTTFYEKISIHEVLNKPKCRLCERNFSGQKTNDGGAHLISQLMMPTYIKDLNNVQLKLIWQNASVELSESTKLIFMGYSFPSADFELRELFARSVPHNTKIEIVLLEKNVDAERRYKSFFGKRKISFIYGGVEKYIDAYINAAI